MWEDITRSLTEALRFGDGPEGEAQTGTALQRPREDFLLLSAGRYRKLASRKVAPWNARAGMTRKSAAQYGASCANFKEPNKTQVYMFVSVVLPGPTDLGFPTNDRPRLKQRCYIDGRVLFGLFSDELIERFSIWGDIRLVFKSWWL